MRQASKLQRGEGGYVADSIYYICHSFCGLLLAVPVVELGDADGERRRGGVTEGGETRQVEELAGGAVGLCAVPLDAPLVVRRLSDERGERADGDLFARADVDVRVADLSLAGRV